jgi:F-type H+-transporting ATPase subunit b
MELDWVTFGLEVINFLVLVWILQHFLYKPVLQTIRKRQAGIEKAMKEAENGKAQAEDLRKQCADRLAGWEKEKESLRQKALAEVAEERKRRMDQMQADLDRAEERRKAVAGRRAQEMHEKLQQEARADAARFAAGFLRRLASPSMEQGLVQVLLEDLGKLPEEQRRKLAEASERNGDRVEVSSAFALDEDLRKKVLEGLGKATGRELDAGFEVSTDLMAGLRISIGSVVLHANVSDELDFFAGQMAHAD